MNLQESIRRILREVRVPRDERVQLYKDDNIIVVVPLTHRALQKYSHRCQWCINDDKSEWEDYHRGKHAVIIQRNPKKIKMGITGNPTASEILILERWDNGYYKFRDVCGILGYEFKDEIEMGDYYINITNDINNFATNIVYYSPENGLYDMEDNYLWNFNIEINDIPNVKPEVIEIINNYLQENEETQIQESIRRILREETSHEEIKDIILNGDDFDDWIKAIRIQYGDTVPLYHATTEENSKIIDKEGFKLTYGKNYKSFSKEPILYFQIGESDYVSKNRPVLYRLDVPVDFLYNAEIDMDGPNISEETIFKYVDEEIWEDLPYEIKDIITYFIWNNFKLDGMEIFITNRFLDDPNENIFEDLRPIKVKDISTK